MEKISNNISGPNQLWGVIFSGPCWKYVKLLFQALFDFHWVIILALVGKCTNAYWKNVKLLIQAPIDFCQLLFRQSTLIKSKKLFQALIDFCQALFMPWLEECKNAISGPNQLFLPNHSGSDGKETTMWFNNYSIFQMFSDSCLGSWLWLMTIFSEI